jgi:L,D-transpeptidase catalytic domain
MRSFLIAFTALALFAGNAAQAKVAITVDKDNQQMTVAVDGVQRYRWPVSSGLPSYETPNGSFRAFRMEEDHYSKEFDEAPMPHSIFFTKIGHAIHGTDSVNRLGSPASHGCVRLSRANAATLYALVKEQGVLNTTVTLTGSSQVALARNPRPRSGTAVARRAPQQQYEQQYDNAGDPVVITPEGQRTYPQGAYPQGAYPQARADDGYIYPADGSSTEQRYPAPPRRVYGAQVYPRQQYYGDGGTYQQAPQGGYYQQAPQAGYYQQQPRPYYQQRGLSPSYQD